MLPKDIADRLVGLYLETFESVYRVLHIPTFQREYHDYWNNPASCSDGFRLKFLLVMAVGSCFYEGARRDQAVTPRCCGPCRP